MDLRTFAVSHRSAPKSVTRSHMQSKLISKEKTLHPHTNSLRLRRQKYGSSGEVESMNYVEQARTLVQTLVHFFQVQDKIDKQDKN